MVELELWAGNHISYLYDFLPTLPFAWPISSSGGFHCTVSWTTSSLSQSLGYTVALILISNILMIYFFIGLNSVLGFGRNISNSFYLAAINAVNVSLYVCVLNLTYEVHFLTLISLLK